MKKIFVTTLILFSFISLQAQKRNSMTIGVNAAVSIPMGDFNDVATMGFGLNGIFLYGVSDVFEIEGELGFVSWNGDKVEIASTVVEATESSADIPILAGIRYYFPQRNLKPYATAKLGMHIFTSSSTKTEVKGVEDIEAATKGETNVFFGFVLGGGAVYEVSKGFLIDGALNYNIINGTPDSFTHLTLQIGVLFGIN